MRTYTQPHLTTFRCKFHGIREEIQENLFEFTFIRAEAAKAIPTETKVSIVWLPAELMGTATSVQIGVARDGTPIPNVDPEFVPAFQNVRSGGFAGNALVTDVHAPTHLITLTQVVAVNPDQDIDVGFWMGNDSHHDLGISIGPNHTQIFIDDAGLLASGSRNIGAGSGPGDFVELHRVFNSGSRTNIMVTYEINGSGTAPAAVSFDDFFFTPVPEPATLLALGMGLSIISFARYRAGAWSGLPPSSSSAPAFRCRQ